MPIRFRCSYCNRLLGIASRKAGTDTTCPHCGQAITVPAAPDEDGRTERLDADDMDELIGHQMTERVAEPATQMLGGPRAEPPRPAAAKPGPPPLPKGPAKAPDDGPPLFEADFDELFGKTVPPREPDRPKPPPAAGRDAMSLAEPPRTITLSAGAATLVLCGVVVLLVLAFAAGYFVAK